MSGLGGAAIVFWFLAKVLMAHERALDPADYDMVGVLGRVSSPIRAGGTGEMIYSQEGARRSAAVRSEDGERDPEGTPKWWSRATKKASRTCGAGTN